MGNEDIRAFSSLLVVFRESGKKSNLYQSPGSLRYERNITVKGGYWRIRLNSGCLLIVPEGCDVEALMTENFVITL